MTVVVITKQEKESSGLRGPNWRDQLVEAYTRAKPLVASAGNDKFEIMMSGRECLLLKNKRLVYSSTGINAAYSLARFFVLVKESMSGFFEGVNKRVVDRCVLEGLLRDAVDTNLVTGQDAEKLRDVISTVFWSEGGKEEKH